MSTVILLLISGIGVTAVLITVDLLVLYHCFPVVYQRLNLSCYTVVSSPGTQQGAFIDITDDKGIADAIRAAVNGKLP